MPSQLSVARSALTLLPNSRRCAVRRMLDRAKPVACCCGVVKERSCGPSSGAPRQPGAFSVAQGAENMDNCAFCKNPSNRWRNGRARMAAFIAASFVATPAKARSPSLLPGCPTCFHNRRKPVSDDLSKTGMQVCDDPGSRRLRFPACLQGCRRARRILWPSPTGQPPRCHWNGLHLQRGAAGLLTCASFRTPLLAAFAPLLTPLHTARLGLSV